MQTLEEAAKVPRRKKQHYEPNTEKSRPLSCFQFSHPLHNFRRDHNHCAMDMKLLESPLTPNNYRKKFHKLLCKEEEEHQRLLAERLAFQLLMVLVCQYVAN